MEEFIAGFSEVSDPRQDNVRHNLYEVLIIALCSMLCGGEDCSDMEAFGRAKRSFLRQFLRLKHGIPSHDTFSRVFRRLDPKPFQACFVRFMQRFAQGLEGVIAVDGKSLRGSFDRAAGKSPLHMVHAWAVDQRLLLGQIATDAKSNEITAVPKLLAMLSLKGCRVTADAMSCQRAICTRIVEQGGDYAIAPKGNQGSLHDDVRRFLEDPGRQGDGQRVSSRPDDGGAAGQAPRSGAGGTIRYIITLRLLGRTGPPSPPRPRPTRTLALPRTQACASPRSPPVWPCC